MRKALYLMGILEDTDIQWIARSGKRSIVAAGGTLIQQGIAVEYLYILLDGRVAVQVPNGSEVATLSAGEVVGEISFVDSRPPLASVVSVLPSTVLGIEKNLLKHQLEQDGQFGSRFFRAIALFLADRLRSTTGRLGYAAADGQDNADEIDPDELDADFMHLISMAHVRFDYLIRSVAAS